MKFNYIFKHSSFLAILIIFALHFSSCKDSSTNPELTDEQFIKQVVSSGFSSNQNEEDNLMSKENADLDDGGAVPDNGGGPLNPIDSLSRWGRKVTGVNVNFTLSWSGDTLVTVYVTRTISGNYIIIGWQNGQVDSVTKPYTQVFYRTVVFKRVARTLYPRLNWRLYSVSMLSGGTTQPQVSSSLVEITKVEAYLNGSLTYTFNGPDFTQNVFTTRLFGGSGIPIVSTGTVIQLKVFTTSQLAAADIVAWHWARNSFGFHRIPFTLESQTGSGPYFRVYSKTFDLYPGHILGVFNGYISASTRESLYDDDVSKFASDQVGTPYIVVQ